jgi:hypothetical protein
MLKNHTLLCRYLAFYQRRPRAAFNLAVIATIVCILALVSLNTLFASCWAWWHISPPAYEKVELGMDEPEVVSILGLNQANASALCGRIS